MCKISKPSEFPSQKYPHYPPMDKRTDECEFIGHCFVKPVTKNRVLDVVSQYIEFRYHSVISTNLYTSFYCKGKLARKEADTISKISIALLVTISLLGRKIPLDGP